MIMVQILILQKKKDWSNTKKLLKGKDWIINEIKLSELRGKGRRWFFNWIKMVICQKLVQDHIILL